MTTLPPIPSLPPIVWQELRRDAMKAALQMEIPDRSPGTVMNVAKVLEGFILFGDAAHAWRYAGFPSMADAIEADRAAGKPVSADPAESLPANVSALRRKG